MEMPSIAMRMKASPSRRERRARERSRRVDCIDMSHFRITQELDVGAYRLESINAVRQPAERLWGKTPHQSLLAPSENNNHNRCAASRRRWVASSKTLRYREINRAALKGAARHACLIAVRALQQPTSALQRTT
jgi:hypothetical protein